MFKLLQSIGLISLSFYAILLKHLEIIGKIVYKIKGGLSILGLADFFFFKQKITFLSVHLRKKSNLPEAFVVLILSKVYVLLTAGVLHESWESSTTDFSLESALIDDWLKKTFSSWCSKLVCRHSRPIINQPFHVVLDTAQLLQCGRGVLMLTTKLL